MKSKHISQLVVSCLHNRQVIQYEKNSGIHTKYIT